MPGLSLSSSWTNLVHNVRRYKEKEASYTMLSSVRSYLLIFQNLNMWKCNVFLINTWNYNFFFIVSNNWWKGTQAFWEPDSYCRVSTRSHLRDLLSQDTKWAASEWESSQDGSLTWAGAHIYRGGKVQQLWMSQQGKGRWSPGNPFLELSKGQWLINVSFAQQLDMPFNDI